jgi:stage II sporulation protein D
MVYFEKIIRFVLFCVLFIGCAVPAPRRQSVTRPVTVTRRPAVKTIVPKKIEDAAAGQSGVETVRPAKPASDTALYTNDRPEPVGAYDEDEKQQGELVKICISDNASRVMFGASCEVLISVSDDGRVYGSMPAGRHEVFSRDSNIVIEGKEYPSGIKLMPAGRGCVASIDGKKYRGGIIFIAAPGDKLRVINQVGLEAYVCGIITKEISSDWPVESIKAQAVVARTYALKNPGKHSGEGYDLCARPHCQVYGGMDAETAVTNDAVKETAGEVLFYDGALASVFYHSSCGGRTEPAARLWRLDPSLIKYLSGVKCGFCREDRWYNWTKKITFAELEDSLDKAGYSAVKKIKSIKTSGKSASGRVANVVIKYRKGTIVIPAHKFRLAAGPDSVRSTNFSVKTSGGAAYFTGHGWGHGIGMCQWGARGMAAAGYEYEKILKHYFPGCYIEKYGK